MWLRIFLPTWAVSLGMLLVLARELSLILVLSRCFLKGVSAYALKMCGARRMSRFYIVLFMGVASKSLSFDTISLAPFLIATARWMASS